MVKSSKMTTSNSAKISVWISVLRNEGVFEFLIKGLQFIQKHTQKQSVKNGLSSNPIYTKARYRDVLNTDITTTTARHTMSRKRYKSLAWIMPPPGKGSGGHLNIFRFVKFLEDAGYSCNVYLYVSGEHGTIAAVRQAMGDSYPKLKAIETMQWLEPNMDIDSVDGIFATSWETAYASCALASTAKRFYFIQDFEPYFYPVGGMYSLAENTYKLGFYGITAGNWLKQKLSSEYNMRVDSFDFASDADIYSHSNTARRKEIFYYARPYTERRGFEVGILALDIFHQEHPDYIINLVGWDVSEYSLPFPFNNLKTLEITELSDLYNRCAAGLVLSYTNMSLLPLELLRCGTIPVVNDGPNNRLVSDNNFIAYANNDPHSLARKLSEIVSRPDLIQYSQSASQSVDNISWDASGEHFLDTVIKEINQ
jgi:O-antigen biosynthesis protein